jgi:hypothetical protein
MGTQKKFVHIFTRLLVSRGNFGLVKLNALKNKALERPKNLGPEGEFGLGRKGQEF